LVPVFIVFAVSLGLFLLLRMKFEKVYQPRAEQQPVLKEKYAILHLKSDTV